MNYEFVHEEDFLIIKLSGSTSVNERLLTKESLTPYLRQSHQKVIVDLEGLGEDFNNIINIIGISNAIKKEFQLIGGKVKLCSLRPSLDRHFRENRWDQILDIVQSVEQAKRSFTGKSNGN